MIILQRWEPTVATFFPSQIPFWLKVHGVPSHMWSKAMLVSLAENIGHYKTYEITTAAARVRVQIDGLKPLITSSTLEFATGEEVTAELVYEKLERHCSVCLKLTHNAKDCPENEETLPLPTRNSKKQVRDREVLEDNRGREINPHKYQRNQSISRPEEVTRSYASSYSKREERNGSRYEREPRYSDCRLSHNKGVTRSFNLTQSRDTNYTELRRKENVPHKPIWIEKRRRELPRALLSSQETSASSTRRSPNLATSQIRSPRHLPPENIQAAIGEVREVMVWYSSCIDPTESVARRERYRLAEAKGQVEETASQMVLAALEQSEKEKQVSNSQSRLPALPRLGTTNEAEQPEINAIIPALPPKRKPGKPSSSRMKGPLGGAGSMKRKVLAVKPSPRKRVTKLAPKKVTKGGGIKQQEKGGPSGTHRPDIPRDTSSNQSPIQRAKAKKQMDFSNLSSPLP